MIYALPFRLRERLARNKRERYWRDPEFRLKCINTSRAKKGLPPVSDLADVETRGPVCA